MHNDYFSTKIKKILMKELLNNYEHKQPEIVFEWRDTETEAEGWVVINSLRGERRWWDSYAYWFKQK